jgi:hypothetical protein
MDSGAMAQPRCKPARLARLQRALGHVLEPVTGRNVPAVARRHGDLGAELSVG